ncbi:hypothetical protein MtrunA17_Chr5g0441551 [Medicago truncatula]|uniref:Uncharacterized protein n=1 Tax=Medicago truncatula TaxID=3880 RepID=A0A396HYG7_MEDTR|nr:hypothetical protein MtrunA17_Chr5g0441551 [Medicago truncatula]
MNQQPEATCQLDMGSMTLPKPIPLFLQSHNSFHLTFYFSLSVV